MKIISKLALAAVVLTVGIAAAQVTLNPGSPSSPYWAQTGPQQWSLTANNTPGGPIISGCLGENATQDACEPQLYLINNTAFASPNGQEFEYQIMDSSSGPLSDQFYGETINGQGFMGFWSDPHLHTDITGDPYVNLGPICTEDNQGCDVTFALALANGGNLLVPLASDGEAYFDPFNVGYDTSDNIKFDVPEPGIVILLGTSLFSFAGLKKLRK